MTLRLIKKGLTESEEKCPNCGNAIYVFKDDKGKTLKVYGAHLLGIRQINKIRCDRCSSEYQVE